MHPEHAQIMFEEADRRKKCFNSGCEGVTPWLLEEGLAEVDVASAEAVG